MKHHVIRDKLLVIKALTTLNKSCLNSITNHVETYVYSPTDHIITENGYVTGVYIIVQGCINRTNRRKKDESIELHENEIFGEKGLVENYIATHTYIAKTYTEVLFLPGAIFRHICQMYCTSIEIENLIFSLNLLNQHNNEIRKQNNRKPAFVKIIRKSIFGIEKINYIKPKNTIKINKINKNLKNSMFIDLYRICMKPNSLFRLWWNIIIFLSMILYIISCGLLLQAILRQNFINNYYNLLILCYIIDVFFIIDTLFYAFFFTYDDNGLEITNYKEIFYNYMQNTTIVIYNLILIFPFDLIFGILFNYQLIPILRLLKIGHIYKFNSYYENVIDIIFIYTGITLSFELSRFIYLYMILFFLCHWCGCIWTLLAEVGIKLFGYNISWRIVDSQTGFYSLNYASLSNTLPYWRELYWTVNVMSSIGWPSILPTNTVEYIGISLMMFVGYLLFTTLVGALSSLMGSFNSTGRNFNTKVDKIRQLVKHKSVSKEIETKIVR